MFDLVGGETQSGSSEVLRDNGILVSTLSDPKALPGPQPARCAVHGAAEQGGRLRGQLRLRRSEQRQAALEFQRTVLRAWSEADDALTAFAETQARRDALAEAVRQSEAALLAAQQRYTQGAADFLNVVSSEADVLRAQDQLAQADTEIAADLVRLYRALGG